MARHKYSKREQVDRITNHLKQQPGQTGKDIAAATGISESAVFLRLTESFERRGGRPALWFVTPPTNTQLSKPGNGAKWWEYV